MKKRIFTFVVAASFAITAGLTFATFFGLPEKPASVTNFSALEAKAHTKVAPVTEPDLSHSAEPIDYKAIYPYVLMSYFAEMYKVSSTSAKKQKALEQRLYLLGKAGFSMVTTADFIPQEIRPFFIAEVKSKKDPKKVVVVGRFHHKSSGFKARLFINPKETKAVIAIAGTDFSSVTSMGSAYSLGNGTVSEAAKIARLVATEIQKAYPQYTVELTGASQGGALAQYAAMAPEVNGRAIVFNSQGIHSSITSKWTKEQLQRISHAYLDGELLNGNSYSSYPVQSAVQNEMPVTGVVIPVDPVLEDRISNIYYNTSGSRLSYSLTPRSFMLHWTGSLLEAVEYHADYNYLQSLY